MSIYIIHSNIDNNTIELADAQLRESVITKMILNQDVTLNHGANDAITIYLTDEDQTPILSFNLNLVWENGEWVNQKQH